MYIYVLIEHLFCHTDSAREESARKGEEQASQQGTAISDLGTISDLAQGKPIYHNTPSASLELSKEPLTRIGLSSLNGWSTLYCETPHFASLVVCMEGRTFIPIKLP